MTLKRPDRKRTFNPEADVVPLLAAWQVENRHVIESRMINDALRQHLARYRLKAKHRREVAA
jgi:hypothetical protein